MEPAPSLRTRLLEAFPFARELEPSLLDELLARASYRKLPARRYIRMEGDACSDLALLLSGGARVFKTAESGREITLYRIEPGESCILTASCILSGETFPAFAQTEEPAEALLVPAPVFRSWVARHEAWREYVFRLLSRRFSSVLAVLEAVTFQRMDDRLAGYLLHGGGARPDPTLETTHERIAAELGSSREVISRLLKEFEREGLVRLSRGHVHVVDARRLRERSEGRP